MQYSYLSYSYKNYQNIRDLVWEILVDLKINELPIKVSYICTKLKIEVATYQNNIDVLKKLKLYPKCYDFPAFSTIIGGEIHIFINEKTTDFRGRFTLAHELGHVMLGHVTKGGFQSFTKNQEKDANSFAARLLSPVCVLWALKVKNATEISEICGISMQSATYRYKRLEELIERDKRFKKERGHGCFLLSHIEKVLFLNFQPYIKRYKRERLKNKIKTYLKK